MTRTLILLLLFPLASSAQSSDSCQIQLNGYVLDEHDQSELSLATLWLEEANTGAISDSTGRFEIKDLCPGWHTLSYSHLGCEPGELRFFLQNDTTLVLELEHHENWLSKVTVRGLRYKAAQVQNNTELSGWQLDQLQSSSLAESIASVAGVRMLQTGPGISKPVIHGLHSNRIAIFNNGVRQQGQAWGVDHPPEIDPFSADRLQVIKGVAALQYGIGAMGGVVLTQADPLPQEAGLKGEAMLIGQTNGRQGTLASKWEGGWKKLEGFGWRLQGSVHRGGDWHTPQYQLSNTGSTQGATSLGLGYKNGQFSTTAYYSFFQSEWGVLRGAHIGNYTDFLEAIQRDTPFYTSPFTYAIDAPRQWTRHHLAKTEIEFRPNKTGVWAFNYSFQKNDRQEFDIRRSGRTAKPAMDLDLNSHQISLDWKPYFKGTAWHAIMGVSAQYQQNRNIPGTGVRPLIPWYNRTTTGIYGIGRYTRSHGEIEAGIRFDFQQLFVKRFDSQDLLISEKRPFQGLSASIGFSLQPGHFFTIRAQTATTFRPPHVNELFSQGLHHAVASIEQGNPALNSEKALKGVAGIEFHPETSLHIKLEGHYAFIRDYIYLSPENEPLLTIQGVFPVFTYMQTDAVLWGMDANASWEILPRISLDLQGSLLRSRDLLEDTYLIFIPADLIESALRYDLQTNKKITDAHFSIGVVRVGRQNRAPEEIDLLPPPDAYTRLQASASCRLLLRNRSVSLFLKATNLLNASYRDYLNRLRYFADEPGRNIELRIKIDF